MRTKIALLLAFASTLSQAQPVDGQKLDEWTKAHERTKTAQANSETKSAYDMIRSAKIVGYVSGVIDARQNENTLCIPDEVDLGQRVSAVETWIEAHPDQLQQRGDALVVLALNDAFPCPA